MRGGLWNKGSELGQVNSCVVKRIMNFTSLVILIKFFSYLLSMINKWSRKLTIRWHGIRGLGTELVKWVIHWYFSIFLNILFLKNRRSEALAKERGCSHTFVLASGKYSAAVFDKLGHKMVSPHFFSSIFIIIDYFDLTGEKCGLCRLRWLQRRASP